MCSAAPRPPGQPSSFNTPQLFFFHFPLFLSTALSLSPPFHFSILLFYCSHLSVSLMEYMSTSLQCEQLLVFSACVVFNQDLNVCSSHRYMGRWRSPQAVDVQPPFLRPPLTEAQLEAKVLDNGIQNDRHSTRVSETKSNKRTKTSKHEVHCCCRMIFFFYFSLFQSISLIHRVSAGS